MSLKVKIKNKFKNQFFPIPDELKKNHIYLDKEKMQLIEKSIRENFHIGWRSEKNFTKEAYKEDLQDHIKNRIENDRRRIIPWLNNSMPLEGKKILEIGCGTGSSSIALAEQGAKVIGIDLDEGALKVANDRKEAYNLDVDNYIKFLRTGLDNYSKEK